MNGMTIKYATLNKIRLASLPVAFLVLSSCSPETAQNSQLVIGNAIDADSRIVEDADERADRLDQRSEELSAQADAAGNSRAPALRAEAARDLKAAEEIRAQGQAAGADASDHIEQDAGLTNRQ